jgi:hypothetical protein
MTKKKMKYRRVTVRFHKVDGSTRVKMVGDLLRYIDGEATVRFGDNDETTQRYKLVAEPSGDSASTVVAMYKVGLKAFANVENASVIVSISGL